MPRRRHRKRRSRRRRTPVGQSALPPDVRFVMHPQIGTASFIPAAARPNPNEPMFMDLRANMENQSFDSDDEMQAFLNQYLRPGTVPNLPQTSLPWQAAMQKAYAGWDERSAAGRERAARQALDIFPDLPDPYLLRAVDAGSWEEACELCEQAVAAGERWLGPNLEEEYEDVFWRDNLTRPYLRARFARGYCAWRLERREEARDDFAETLRLNPDDNQGVRYPLAAVLLELEDHRGVRKVMSRYAGDRLAYWDYNWALLEFRARGRGRRAHRRLVQAASRAPLVAYQLQQGEPRQQELEFLAPGEESEATEYWQLYHMAWEATPGALEWLRDELEFPADW